jgi:hypothetical protein
MSLSSEAAIGIGFAGFLGCCLCLILGILLRRHRSRQRIAVTSIKQLQHLFSSMDTDRSWKTPTPNTPNPQHPQPQEPQTLNPKPLNPEV